MPESARWLVSRNRIEEATEIVSKAAKVNGTKLPADFTLEQETTPIVSIKALGSAKTLLCRSFIIFLNWLVLASLSNLMQEQLRGLQKSIANFLY